MTLQPAVFLDRDGVLVDDRGFVTKFEELHIFPGVPEALRHLGDAGFRLVVVTNQAVVARGMIDEVALAAIHTALDVRLQEAGAPPLDAVFACPHHPEATVEAYRIVCDCRKPRPGALRTAATQLGLDLSASFMVGDRMSDILAGRRAGCRTVLIDGPHRHSPAIVSVDAPEDAEPDHIASNLLEAATWILGQTSMGGNPLTQPQEIAKNAAAEIGRVDRDRFGF